MTEILYRFYNESGQLLYVGVTNSCSRRWAEHAEVQPWWDQVATIRIERYPDRDAVLRAERWAIHAQRPRHNQRGPSYAKTAWTGGRR